MLLNYTVYQSATNLASVCRFQVFLAQLLPEFGVFQPSNPPKQQKTGKNAKNKTVGIEVLIVIR